MRNSRAVQEHLEHPSRASRDDAKVSLSKSSSCYSQKPRRCRPRRARERSCRVAATARRTLLLWPDPPDAPDPTTVRRGALSAPHRSPLSRFQHPCPALRARAGRARPDGLFSRTAGGFSWLKPCSRSCRGLCAWRGPFRCAVGEEGVSRPHGGSACSRRCSAPFCPHAPFHVFTDTPMAHQPCRGVLCGVFGDFWGSHGPECHRNRALWCRR